jgi:hypothetical protein
MTRKVGEDLYKKIKKPWSITSGFFLYDELGKCITNICIQAVLPVQLWQGTTDIRTAAC